MGTAAAGRRKDGGRRLEAARSVNPPFASNLEADIYPTKHAEHLCLGAILMLLGANWRLGNRLP
jgi:hypothetical protein